MDTYKLQQVLSSIVTAGQRLNPKTMCSYYYVASYFTLYQGCPTNFKEGHFQIYVIDGRSHFTYQEINISLATYINTIQFSTNVDFRVGHIKHHDGRWVTC